MIIDAGSVNRDHVHMLIGIQQRGANLRLPAFMHLLAVHPVCMGMSGRRGHPELSTFPPDLRVGNGDGFGNFGSKQDIHGAEVIPGRPCSALRGC